MTRALLLLLLLVGGCLGQPQPHGVPSDALDGDAHHDGGEGCDPSPTCPWSCPVAITTDGVMPMDAVTSPWMAVDRSSLIYTLLPYGDSASADLVQAAQVGQNHYGVPVILQQHGANHSYDNPMFDDPMTLWFDDASGANRVIAEGDIMQLQFAVDHDELGLVVREPSVIAGGKVIYYFNATTGRIARATRSNPPSSFTAIGDIVRMDNLTDLIESPTSVDDHVVYVASHSGSGGETILEMTLSSDHTAFVSSAVVGTFQMGGKYFDPSLTADQKVLVFASDRAGGHSRLYYIERSCVP
jgi:hypothetical protein